MNIPICSDCKAEVSKWLEGYSICDSCGDHPAYVCGECKHHVDYVWEDALYEAISNYLENIQAVD